MVIHELAGTQNITVLLWPACLFSISTYLIIGCFTRLTSDIQVEGNGVETVIRCVSFSDESTSKTDMLAQHVLSLVSSQLPQEPS